MSQRMHLDIEHITPVLEKFNTNWTLDVSENKVLSELTEEKLKGIFEWIQEEKKITPTSPLVSEQWLYTRFLTAYNIAQQKDEALRKISTDATRKQLAQLNYRVVNQQTNPPTSQVSQTTALEWANTYTTSMSLMKEELPKIKDGTIPSSFATLLNDRLSYIESRMDDLSSDDRAFYYEYVTSILAAGKRFNFQSTTITSLKQIQAKLDIKNDPLTKRFQKYKADMVTEISQPYTVEGLKKALGTLSEEKDPDKKRILTSIIWSKLAGSEYTMTIQNGKISLQHPTDQKNAELLEAAIEAHISARKISITDFQQAILMGSGNFGSYLDTQGVNISNISTEKYVTFLTEYLGIDLTKGAVTDKIRCINQSKASNAEKAFLISYVNGGFTGYNLAPDAKRELELKAMDASLATSTEHKIAKGIVGRVSGGQMEKEAESMKKWGKKEELTVESFMANPTRAITHYPWTSLALITGSIWKFGFGKTIFGLLASVIGLKAINEIGKDTDLGKQIQGGIQDGWNTMVGKGKEVAGTVTQKVQEVTQDTKEKQESASQKVISDKIRASEEFKKILDPKRLEWKKMNAPLNKYLDFINFEINDKPVSIFLDTKTSIFSKDTPLDSSITLPSDFDPAIFKSIMRMYFTWHYISTFKLEDESNKKLITDTKQELWDGKESIQTAIVKMYTK